MVWVGIALVAGLVVGSSIAYLLAARRVRVSIARVHNARKRAQAAEHLAEIGSMTGGLAHEIKNPLSTIGLNAQLLSEAIEDLPIDEQDRSRLVRRIDALGRETERLRGILEDFLEYAGELRLDLRPTELNDLIEQLGDFFHVQAQSSGVQIRLDPSPSPVTLDIDSNHIKQALLNLMINAVNAMKQSGESGNELILRVSANPDGGASIHVIDTGPGISKEDQERIFHPYFTTRASGTGLGLPTARRIADAHGGSLEIHSELGKGSVFSIILPAHQAPPN